MPVACFVGVTPNGLVQSSGDGRDARLGQTRKCGATRATGHQITRPHPDGDALWLARGEARKLSNGDSE